MEWAGGSATATAIPPDRRNHTAAATIPLGPAEVALGRVQRDVVEDWYAITVPGGHHSIRLQLGGTPFVGATLELRAPDGTLIPLTVEPGAIGRGGALGARRARRDLPGPGAAAEAVGRRLAQHEREHRPRAP